MIPKIIHYVWLGNALLPEDMQKCMDSWKKWMPEYQLMRWDDEAIRDIDSVFVREALLEKKWAFASDVIRLYAIHKYGGIYMDTDVMVYRSFDPLLQNKAFIGRENSMHQIGKTMEVYLTTCCLVQSQVILLSRDVLIIMKGVILLRLKIGNFRQIYV